MPQPKAPGIDWLLESWRLAELLPQVPSKRLAHEGGALPLADGVIEHLDATQETLNVIEHLDALQEKLNVQMNHAIGKAVRTAAQRKKMPRFEGTDVRVILATADALLAMVSGTDSDLGVVDVGITAHKMLAYVRQHRQLSDDQRVKLPVIVAAMAGGSAAVQNAIAAKRQRTRRQDLRAAKQAAMARHRGTSWKELLNTLLNDGVVKDWDHSWISWTDDQGVERTTATSTFRGWRRTT